MYANYEKDKHNGSWIILRKDKFQSFVGGWIWFDLIRYDNLTYIFQMYT